jgi:preprotein translocase subunit YajC
VDDRTVTLDVGGGTKVRVVKTQVSGPWKAVEATPAKVEAKK